jgi:F0F1-type ATP synthase delta subunit
MKQNYISAAYLLLQDNVPIERVLDGLHETVIKRGHKKLHKSILAGLLSKMSLEKSEGTTIVTIAKHDAEAKNMKKIKAALDSLEAPKKYDIEIDESIIGGVVIHTKDKQIDASYKTKLIKLYRSFI